MARIAAIEINQLNRQFDTLDAVQRQVSELQDQVKFAYQQVAINDPIHAPNTTNNLALTWTGGTQLLSWPQAFVKDKNWQAQTLARPAQKSSAPGQQHIYTIPAGSLPLAPSTYYWIGWDPVHQIMLAESDASLLHGNYNVHVLCQIYTGTTGQTGSAGGGGSTGGVDLSGSRYKNF